MTSTYTPESATYAWSEADRQYGRPYAPPAARPGWYDGYGPMDRPQYMPAPASVAQSGSSTSLQKGAMVAGLLAAVVGGALLGTFVLSNSTSEPSPSVYMVPESSAPAAPAPAAAPPAPQVAPPAPSSTTTVVVPGRAPAPVIVPPANRGQAPVFAPAPRPAAPNPAPVPPPPPAPAPAPAPQVRIEGIPIPIPMPGQTPADQGEDNEDEQGTPGQGDQGQGGQGQGTPGQGGQGQGTPGQGDQGQGGQGQGGQPTGGAGGSGPDLGQFGTTRQDAGSSTLHLPPSLGGAGDQNPCVDPQSLRNC